MCIQNSQHYSATARYQQALNTVQTPQKPSLLLRPKQPSAHATGADSLMRRRRPVPPPPRQHCRRWPRTRPAPLRRRLQGVALEAAQRASRAQPGSPLGLAPPPVPPQRSVPPPESPRGPIQSPAPPLWLAPPPVQPPPRQRTPPPQHPARPLLVQRPPQRPAQRTPWRPPTPGQGCPSPWPRSRQTQVLGRRAPPQRHPQQRLHRPGAPLLVPQFQAPPVWPQAPPQPTRRCSPRPFATAAQPLHAADLRSARRRSHRPRRPTARIQRPLPASARSVPLPQHPASPPAGS
mmetsp:Transcript_49007/g.153330  ORF Transcript_49007/g.153330 Transcript_49007/m.153330 type:complete len:291 (-) Transcript_49007:850-1722(-)